MIPLEFIFIIGKLQLFMRKISLLLLLKVVFGVKLFQYALSPIFALRDLDVIKLDMY